MAESDIKLNGNTTIVDGDYLEVHTLDVHLDNPTRRKVSGGYRRALVHGPDDALMVNYEGDYPGGTVVHGRLTVDHKGPGGFNGDIFVTNGNGKATLSFFGTSSLLLLHDQESTTRISMDARTGDITLAAIGSLVQKIQNLEQRLTALEQPSASTSQE